MITMVLRIHLFSDLFQSCFSVSNLKRWEWQKDIREMDRQRQTDQARLPSKSVQLPMKALWQYLVRTSRCRFPKGLVLRWTVCLKGEWNCLEGESFKGVAALLLLRLRSLL